MRHTVPVSTSIIILDTNVLAGRPYLDSHDWRSLYGYADRWNLRFFVPEVVFMETVNVVRRLWKPEIDRLRNMKSWFEQLGKLAEWEAALSAVVDQRDRYAEALKKRLEALGVEIEALPPSIDHMDIARRASEGRAPYALGGTRPAEMHLKDGYRDTLCVRMG